MLCDISTITMFWGAVMKGKYVHCVAVSKLVDVPKQATCDKMNRTDWFGQIAFMHDIGTDLAEIMQARGFFVLLEFTPGRRWRVSGEFFWDIHRSHVMKRS